MVTEVSKQTSWGVGRAYIHTLDSSVRGVDYQNKLLSIKSRAELAASTERINASDSARGQGTVYAARLGRTRHGRLRVFACLLRGSRYCRCDLG